MIIPVPNHSFSELQFISLIKVIGYIDYKLWYDFPYDEVGKINPIEFLGLN